MGEVIKKVAQNLSPIQTRMGWMGYFNNENLLLYRFL
jgi:hypothetical protein